MSLSVITFAFLLVCLIWFTGGRFIIAFVRELSYRENFLEKTCLFNNSGVYTQPLCLDFFHLVQNNL